MKSLITTLIFGVAMAGNGVFAAEFSDVELEELGQSYAQAINALDANALDNLISARHLAQEIADFAGDNPDETEELFHAFEDAIPNISKHMLLELERQRSRAVYIRVHEFDGMHGPLVRYSVGDGYNYVLLLPVRPASNGSTVRIRDMYYATGGELLSQTIGITTKLAMSPSETFLGKLFGVNEVDHELVSLFDEVGRLRHQNKLREAFEVLDQVQGSTRNHRVILMSTIQIAFQLDEGLYRQELRRLAAHYKNDPRVAFTLLDHYFFENDFDSAMSIIDLMEQTYGTDAVIYLFRANVESARNRLDPALSFAERAVQLEPDNENAQWTLLTVLVQAQRFGESVKVLQALESEFGYLFGRGDFEAEPLYAEFVRSDEFAQWIDAR